MKLLITAASIIIGLAYFIYHKSLKKPKNLEHLPSISLYDYLRYQFMEAPRDFKIEATTKPLNQHKVQAIFDLGVWKVLISDPKVAKILYNDTINFPKDIPIESQPDKFFSKFMGFNLLFSNHDLWKRYRKVLNPPFKKQFNVDIFTTPILNFFKVIENHNGKDVEIYKYMQKVTMDALGKGIMGVNFNSVLNEKVDFIEAYNDCLVYSFKPFYFIFSFFDKPWNPFRKPAYDTLNKLESYFNQFLTKKKKNLQFNDISNADEDILTLMLKASAQDDIQFTDKEIRDNIMIFLLAGHDTTALALSSSLHFLAQNLDVQEKARKEIMEVMNMDTYNIKDIEDCRIPTIEQVKEMHYLYAIMKESMRLYPSVTKLPSRVAKHGFEVNGFTVPANIQLDLDIYSIHRDPNNWKDPNTFNPDRFMYDQNYNNVWIPFGGGACSCIGMNFSILEQKLVLSLILSRYRISYDKSCPQAHGAPLTFANHFLLLPVDQKLNFQLLE